MRKSMGLQAGAGRAEICLPEDVFPMEGFVGVRDPLNVRVLLIQQNESAAIVGIEMTSLADEECDALRYIVSEETGIPTKQVWVYVTHTFSAPHIPPAFIELDSEMAAKREKLSNAMHKAAYTAAKQAAERMAPVRLGIGRDICGVNVNRDIDTAQGVWLGMNPNGVSDKNVTVLRLDSNLNSPSAVLFHYGVQSSVMDHCELSDGEQMVTSDLVGKAASMVEETFGPDCVAFFLPGPCGDQAPREKGRYFTVDSDGNMEEKNLHEEGFVFLDRLGAELGNVVIRTVNETVCSEDNLPISHLHRDCICSGQIQDWDAAAHGPRKEYNFQPADNVPLVIEILRMGDIALVGVKPELNCVTGLQLQMDSPCAVTLPVQMVNGGQKYMPDLDSYRKITYEAINSAFACGSAEQFVGWSLELLRQS